MEDVHHGVVEYGGRSVELCLLGLSPASEPITGSWLKPPSWCVCSPGQWRRLGRRKHRRTASSPNGCYAWVVALSSKNSAGPSPILPICQPPISASTL